MIKYNHTFPRERVLTHIGTHLDVRLEDALRLFWVLIHKCKFCFKMYNEIRVTCQEHMMERPNLLLIGHDFIKY